MMHPLVSAVVELVQAAGRATLPYWRADVAVQTKADDSPVTAADLAAHHVLAAGLVALDAAIPVLSEEDCDIGLSEREQWTRWWLVDPLDGTKEFISGSAEYTVNVALIERGRVVFGVVGVPVTDTVFYGGAQWGALSQVAQDAPCALAVRDAPSNALVVVASKRHSSPEQDALLQVLAREFTALELVSVGSSLKFCQLAQGLADVYPRLAPTSQWDTAAAQGVLEGAGGQVINLQGESLTYTAQASYLNPSFVALPKDANWRPRFLKHLSVE